MADKSFSEVIAELKSIEKRFSKIEGKPWNVEGAMIELMKQVGELSALVMTKEGYYFKGRENEAKYKTSTEKIGDELADIFFAVARIANYYNIDLVKANDLARKGESDFLDKKKA